MQNLILSSRIKKQCKNCGITVKVLLENCEMNRNTIYDLEKKGAFPSSDKISRVADCLNCSVDYLLGRTDNPEINRSNEKTHIIKIAARNGSYKELALNDEELEELQRKINSLPEATDL